MSALTTSMRVSITTPEMAAKAGNLILLIPAESSLVQTVTAIRAMYK